MGDLEKSQVRQRAHELGLSVADKPESQEVCFAPKGRYAEFILRYAPDRAFRSGEIIGESGQVLGRHGGIHQYTIGQRRGLGLSAPEPLYVSHIDSASARVKVGPKASTVAGGLIAGRVHWLADPSPVGSRLSVKIRSRFAAVSVRLTDVGVRHFEVRAEEGLWAVTPGQAAVLYEGERVLGGGWIERALPRGQG